MKMGPIINSGHELKQFNGSFGLYSLLTFGADGHVVLRMSNIPPNYGKIFVKFLLVNFWMIY